MQAYIDESGDHNLNPSTLDNLYNVFVLGAVCFKDDDAYDRFDQEFRALKRQLFGTEHYHIHTAEITRPGRSTNPLTRKFYDRDFREEFYHEMNQIIERLPVKIISAGVKKNELLADYQEETQDPYLFTFDFILNQILILCGPHRSCRIYPEKRTYTENNKVEIAMIRAKNGGTKFFKGSEVAERVSEFTLKDKRDDLSGIQLADLVVTPIGRHILGKEPKPDGNEIRYSVVKEKMSRQDFMVFP